VDSRWTQNLKPPEMVALAQARTRSVFVATLGAPVLLVRTGDARGDLGLTLEAALEDGSTAGGWRPEPTLGYDTVVASADSFRIFSAAAAGRSATFGVADLQRRLLRAAHFAVTLQKRRNTGSAFAERISVGRTRNNDIVLRHHSVSKFHAWFECDDEDGFYVNDAKSTNATTVNGTDIARGGAVAVRDGDEIRFGDLVAVFCTAGVLWDALTVGAPPSSRSGVAR
jgi:FHA domain